jgi:hypothetical protein
VTDAPLRHRTWYEDNLEAQMACWSAEIYLLKARLKRDSKTPNPRESAFLHELQEKHDLLSHHLSSLRGASDGLWGNLKIQASACCLALNVPTYGL